MPDVLSAQFLATPALFFQGRALELRENARRTFLSFNRYVRPGYFPYHHTKIVCEELEKFYTGETLRLILTMGPQYGKSLNSSALLPSYMLGRNPDMRILLLSYGSSLAGEFNREVQKVMDSERYIQLFPNSALGQDAVRQISDKPRRNSDVIDIPGHAGMFVNAGIGGSYTGKGFHRIILDDLIKSRAEADSPTYRKETLDAYTDTIRTRRANDKTGIMILNTRWHPEDLTGELLKRAKESPLADQWRVVNLPALLSDCVDIESERWKFPPGQQPGKEVLWPEHFSYDDVISTRASGLFNFSAQYMGTPVAREGNVVKRGWFGTQSLFDYNPTHRPINLYFDLGGSSLPAADRTVGTISAQYKIDENARVMLLHQMSGQWDSPEREERMETYCMAANKLFPSIPIILENTFGLAKDVAPKIRDRLLAKGLNVSLDTVRIPKFARAEPFLASARAGRIELYDGTLCDGLGFPFWRTEFLDEVTMLQQRETPRGPEFFGGHDDRLDSPAGGFNLLTQDKWSGYGISRLNLHTNGHAKNNSIVTV